MTGGRQVGYIRVSTVTQTHDQQRDALQAVGVQPRDVFAEKVSGAAKDRPEFERLLAYVEPGDTIVVSSFDRFGRNVAQVFAVIEQLLERGIAVRGLRENVDTSTAGGQFVAGLFAVLAQYERALTKERTEAWRAGARRRGVRTGRTRKLDAGKVARARKLLVAEDPHRPGVKLYTAAEVAAEVGCSRATLYRSLGSDLQRTA